MSDKEIIRKPPLYYGKVPLRNIRDRIIPNSKKKSADNLNFVPMLKIPEESPTQASIEIINNSLPDDDPENIVYVSEKDAVNKDNEDSDNENATYDDLSHNSNSSSESESESEIGFSSADLKEVREINKPLPATRDKIIYYLSNRTKSGFDLNSIRIEFNNTPITSGVAYRKYIKQTDCYISFFIDREVLEITHFECPGNGKELLYDMIIELFNRGYFFGLVGLEAWPKIYEIKKKDETEQQTLVEYAQKKLNRNYLSMGFYYVDATSNKFSANVVDLLSILEHFERIEKGGQTIQTKKRQTKKDKQKRQTKKKKQKSIKKKHLKRKTKKKK